MRLISALENAITALDPALRVASMKADAEEAVKELTTYIDELDKIAKDPEKPTPNLQAWDPEG